ncbi:Hypothetical protein Eab7_0936 [Exiguobacterium antarcticum B7]|nr:Hypothetical protein Eab7_0936 [Exiguobacterium antarcticum B7]
MAFQVLMSTAKTASSSEQAVFCFGERKWIATQAKRENDL